MLSHELRATLRMIEAEHLDIRTVTMGISLRAFARIAAGVAEGAGCGVSVAVWGRSISPFSHSSDFWGGVGMAHPTHLAMAAKIAR